MRIILSFRVYISAKCLTIVMDIVIISDRLTLEAVLKWTFSKLPANTIGRSLSLPRQGLRKSFKYPRIFLNFIECSWRVSWTSSTIAAKWRGKNYINILRKQHSGQSEGLFLRISEYSPVIFFISFPSQYLLYSWHNKLQLKADYKFRYV